MAESISSKLQLWDDWESTSPGETVDTSHLGWPCPPVDFVQSVFLSEALVPARSRYAFDELAPPLTLQWYLEIERLRHQRYGRWIPTALEFARHAGETLLCVGTGLGTDWVHYARNGAQVIVCCPDAQHLPLIRRNFELRGLSARFLSASPALLPVESNSVDVVTLNSLLDQTSNPAALSEEVFRVLRTGGKVMVLMPARYDVHFWRRLLLPWEWWGHRLRRVSEPVRGYSARELRPLFGQFIEHRIHKRHLRSSDLPPLWRFIPTSLLERLLGRMLILKALKPITSSVPRPLAA
jgi:ubiquinone/menaquinone biosynthesis C-methylase UbiE